MSPLNLSVGVGTVAGGRGEPDVPSLTECSELRVKKLRPSVGLNVGWRSKYLDPLSADSFGDRLLPLVSDELSNNELGEGVPDVDDEGGGLGVALVLLQVDGDDVVKVVGLGHRDSWSRNFSSLHGADLALVKNL